MQKVIAIDQRQDFYVPSFRVYVNGKTADPELIHDIIQVTYQDNLKEVDSFDITINNWDAQTRSFKYSNEPLFDPGQPLELWMGYYGHDRLRPMLKGEITGLRSTFPTSGGPTLVVNGLSVIHTFRKKQESHLYENMKDSAIARKIGHRLGITVRTNDGAEAKEQPYARLVQQNEFDIIFLLERARRNGYDIFVEEKPGPGKTSESQLYFGPATQGATVIYELTYGRSLIEFQPTLNLANQVGEVKVVSHHQESKEKITYTAKRKPIVINGQTRFAKALKRQEAINKPVESKEEARQLATETLQRIAREMITATGSTVGMPDLRAGCLLKIRGLDDLFTGLYFVTATTHTISDGGYTTQFECRREDL